MKVTELPYEQRLDIASNASNQNILEELSQDCSAEVRLNVAKNKHTSGDILDNMAFDSTYEYTHNPPAPADPSGENVVYHDGDILCAIARNPNTPEKTLRSLAKDKLFYVECALADNPSTPPEILDDIAMNNVYSSIALGVSLNPNASEDTLVKLSVSPNHGVKCRMAENINAPLKALVILSMDNDEKIRINVANNPKTPTEILEIISKKDESEEVRKAASSRLQQNK